VKKVLLRNRRSTVRTWLARLVAFPVIATAIVVVNPIPAHAASFKLHMYGVTGTYLGWGAWYSNPAGHYGNGRLEVQDMFADGGNGIIAALYESSPSGWRQVALLSERTNYAPGVIGLNHVKPAPEGPGRGQRIWFRVCKILPDGTWKDCEGREGLNY
jgi:hypothetical protein